MSGKRGQIESFFRTLLLGDFEEDQNFAAQIVGGLISMIPVLDQVMDARDITGTLFRINQRGGFNKAGTDELVNLGFAAFGAIPEVGSAFKTVFKPLWRERRAAKGAVHSGLQAVEGLLGLGKGGAIRWVRQELLGKWGPGRRPPSRKSIRRWGHVSNSWNSWPPPAAGKIGSFPTPCSNWHVTCCRA